MTSYHIQGFIAGTTGLMLGLAFGLMVVLAVMRARCADANVLDVRFGGVMAACMTVVAAFVASASRYGWLTENTNGWQCAIAGLCSAALLAGTTGMKFIFPESVLEVR